MPWAFIRRWRQYSTSLVTRWGRTSETYGEDPYLCSEMGVAFVRGLQGSDLREGVVATAKHFLGYGLSQGGCNLGPVQLSAEELYEVYARPFEAAIREAHMASVMSAYTEVNGSPCSGAPNILSHLLRDRLGFEGFVVADYGAIGQLFSLHGVAGSPSAAGIMALKAGLDVELPVTALYGEQLATDIGEGQIDEAVLDTSVRRVLQAKFQLGLFENPYAELTQLSHVFGDPSPNELAYQLALESLTLLENDGILPLPLTVRSIAVIGPNANSVRNLFSGYTPAAGVEMRHAFFLGGVKHDDGRNPWRGCITLRRPWKRGITRRARGAECGSGCFHYRDVDDAGCGARGGL